MLVKCEKDFRHQISEEREIRFNLIRKIDKDNSEFINKSVR